MSACALKIGVLSSDAESRNSYITMAVGRALRHRMHDAKVMSYGTLMRECRAWQPDVLLVIGGSGADTNILYPALQLAGLSVMWASEDPYELEANKKIARHFDVVVSNDEACVGCYSSASFLPFAADADVHVRQPRSGKDCLFDLFFVGTAWPERIVTLNKLFRHLPRELKLKIGLSGNPSLPNLHCGDLDLLTNFRLSPREFASMANLSRVTLTLDRSFSASGMTQAGATPPPRLFEMAAAGTAQVYLTNGRDTLQFFSPDSIACASNEREAAATIMDLVGNDARRDEAARSAHAVAVDKHLYENRVDALLSVIAQHGPKKRPGPPPSTKERPCILFVTHNIEGIIPCGGVEAYQQSVIRLLRDFQFYLLFWHREMKCLCLVDSEYEIIKRYDVPEMSLFVTSDPLREKILCDIVSEFQITVVDFHHLVGHTHTLPIISAALGVPTIFHVHDYYSVCHEFNLIGLEGRYCGIDKPDVTICDICLSSRSIAPPGSQQRRRLAMGEALASCRTIIHNVEYTKEKLLSVYPHLEANKNVVLGNSARQTTLVALDSGRRTRDPAAHNVPLRLCVLGNFTREKGADLLISLFWQLTDDPIEIHIVGRLESAVYRDVIKQHFKNVVVHGQYKQEDLPRILSDMDLSLHFSIWPETYCISVDEAWAAGVVPIVLGLGALAERVHHGVNGLVVEPTHPYDLVNYLRALIANPDKIVAIRRQAPPVQKKSDEHFEALRSIYETAASEGARLVRPAAPTTSVRLRDLGVRLNSCDWRSSETLADPQQHVGGPNVSAAGASAPAPLREAPLKTWRYDEAFDADDGDIVLRVGDFKASIRSDLAVFPSPSTPILSAAIGVPRTMGLSVSQLLAIFDSKGVVLPVDKLGQDIDRDWFATSIDLRHANSVCLGVAFNRSETDSFLVVGPYISSGARDPRPVAAARTDGAALKHGKTQVTSCKPLSTAVRRRRLWLSHSVGRLGVARAARIHIDVVTGAEAKGSRGEFVARAPGGGFDVRGWLLPARDGSRVTYLEVHLISVRRVLRRRGKIFERPDVSAAFGRSPLERLGFEVAFANAEVTPGVYTMAVMAKLSDGRDLNQYVGSLKVH